MTKEAESLSKLRRFFAMVGVVGAIVGVALCVVSGNIVGTIWAGNAAIFALCLFREIKN